MNLRCRLAAAAAVTGGACLLRSEYEKDQLSVERYHIRSPKVSDEKRTFVFLTDLHDKEFGEKNERLLEAVKGEEPDAVLVGGDTMVAKGKGELRVSLELMAQLSSEFPVYAANGNHESRMEKEREVYGDRYDNYQRALSEMGVYSLVNEAVDFGGNFRIFGADLPASCYKGRKPGLSRDFLKETFGPAPEDKFSILLAHSPVFFREYSDWGADLTLSGHFHGGTVRIPGLGGLMTPQYQFFYPWCAGMVKEQDHKMIVGRGLGTHSIRIRFNNKPQVVVVRITK